MIVSPSAVDAYRLLRRALLLVMPKGPRANPNLNLAEFVEMFAGRPVDKHSPPGKLGHLFREKFKSLGIPERELMAYTPDEWEQLAIAYAADIRRAEGEPEAIERAEAWPNWPEGWRDSLATAEKAAAERTRTVHTSPVRRPA